MPTSTTAAFGCPATLPAPLSCWLGLLGAGGAPAAYAGALLFYYQHQRRRLRQRGRGGRSSVGIKEEGGAGPVAVAESKLDGSGGTEGGSNGSSGSSSSSHQEQGQGEGHAPKPKRWWGVIKHGARPNLFWREALIYCHVGYQLYRLLPLLGALVEGGGGTGEFWWGHNMVRACLFVCLFVFCGVSSGPRWGG